MSSGRSFGESKGDFNEDEEEWVEMVGLACRVPFGRSEMVRDSGMLKLEDVGLRIGGRVDPCDVVLLRLSSVGDVVGDKGDLALPKRDVRGVAGADVEGGGITVKVMKLLANLLGPDPDPVPSCFSKTTSGDRSTV